MKNIILAIALLTFFACKESPGEASSEATNIASKEQNPLIGSWRVVSTLNLSTHEKEQESKDYFHIFSKDYHMILVTGENRPKVFKEFSEMNCEELKSQAQFSAGMLKYELRGNAIYSYYISAVATNYIGKQVIDEFEFRGDTLVHRNDDYNDGQMREWKLVRMDRQD